MPAARNLWIRIDAYTVRDRGCSSQCRTIADAAGASASQSIFIVCYVALALATRYYLVRPFGITPWNPSAGLALALLLVFGYRLWPALAIATLHHRQS